MKKPLILLSFCVFAFGILLPPAALGNDYNVSTQEGLQWALDNSAGNQEDDTITVVGTIPIISAPLHYNSSQNHSLTILGYGGAVISGDHTDGLLTITNTGGDNARVTIQDLTFRDGTAGLAVSASGDITVERVVFDNNAGPYPEIGQGGAKLVSSSFTRNVTVKDSIFQYNRRGFGEGGGGLYVSAYRVTIDNNFFYENRLETVGKGGGVYITAFGPVAVRRNRFTENSAVGGAVGVAEGGGLYLQSSSVADSTDIDNNYFVSNRLGEDNYGGGGASIRALGPVTLSGNYFLYNKIDKTVSAGSFDPRGGGARITLFSSMSKLIAVNNIIWNNYSFFLGAAGMHIGNGDLGTVWFTNNTVISNKTYDGETAGLEVVGAADIYNNIFWSNYVETSPTQSSHSDLRLYNASRTVKLFNNCFDNVVADNPANLASDNNLVGVDPKLSNGNFWFPLFLTSDSPVINKGDNSAPGLPATDILGANRIFDGVVDMGAHEYAGEVPPPPPPEVIPPGEVPPPGGGTTENTWENAGCDCNTCSTVPQRSTNPRNVVANIVFLAALFLVPYLLMKRRK